MYRGLLLLAALAALFCGGQSDKFCLQTTAALYKVSELEALKTEKPKKCPKNAGGADETVCTECYTDVTKTDSKYIQYTSVCGDKKTTEWICKNDVPVCNVDTEIKCYTELAKLLLSPSSGTTTLHCDRTIMSTVTATKSVSKEKVICAGDKCAFGVGYSADVAGKAEIGYIGCKAECEALMKDRKKKDGKTTADCTVCTGDKCTLPKEVKDALAKKTPGPSSGGDTKKNNPNDAKTTSTASTNKNPTTTSDSISAKSSMVGVSVTAGVALVARAWFNAVDCI